MKNITNNETRHRASTSMYSVTFCGCVYVARIPPVETHSPDRRSNVENAPVDGQSPASSVHTPRRVMLP